MFTNKSILARLLANENIQVIQGNYKTASFNVETRVLQLPMWKEMSTDVYDLLVGHEVAHALWTPRENLAVEGVPFSFVNVVEDIRIEKKILEKYPGLIRNFSRGYLDLVERNIFGTEGQDLNAMHFMDRLNIKAKGREHVDIEFSEEEMHYFNRAMSVETFEDVRIVVKELADWLREKQKEEANESPITIVSDTHESAESAGEEYDEGESPDDSSSTVSAPSESEAEPDESEESSESAEDGVSSEESEESGESDTSKAGEETEESGSPSDDPSEKSEEPEGLGEKEKDNASNSKGPAALAEVGTDIAQHENELGLVDDSKVYIQPMMPEDVSRVLVSYKDILAARREYLGDDVFCRSQEAFDAFMAESKPLVNMMVKEFEMRKAAYRTQRARTSSKGTLDVNKIHSYKYNDNLFKQITTLADGKNHGMMMLIDYSGSMNQALDSVIRQTINLIQFCKRVNIPFQVFAFTSDREYIERRGDTTHFEWEDLVLLELFNSKMSKSDYEYAIRSFFHRAACRWDFPRIEELGSTPLDAAIMATGHLIKQFRRANPVHKMNLITLTDGDSNGVNVIHGDDSSFHDLREKGGVMIINGKEIELKARWYMRGPVTSQLLDAAIPSDVKKINYFIADRRQLPGIVSRDVIGHWVERWDYDKIIKTVRKNIREDGVYVNDNMAGYDRQFILQLNREGQVVDDAEELEVTEGMTTRQLAKAFSKFGNSKKKSRIVTRKFAEIVA